MLRRLALGLVGFAVLTAGCSNGDDDAAPDTTTPSTIETVVSTTTAAPVDDEAAVEGEPSLLASRLEQVVGWINGEPLDEAGYTEAFSEAFRSQIRRDDLVGLFAQVSASAPWTVVDEELGRDGLTLVALLTPADVAPDIEVTLTVSDDASAVIEGLLLAPADAPEPTATSEEAADALAELGSIAVAAFDVADGCDDPVLDRGADVQAPIGSAFKLWVLAALLDRVESGELAWDDEVTIEDRFDSLPSGTTQDEPAGTILTVRTLAERMISISDNTATDILIDLVGRAAVEETMLATGHAAPELNRPFPTTRDLFVLKFDDELRAEFLAADEAGRRALLDGPVSAAPLPDLDTVVSTWTAPIDVETVEWFASPTDLCRVLVRLVADEETRAVLSLDPGIPDGAGRWTYIGFKGGSEPGVLNLSWVVEAADGASYVVAGSLWRTDRFLDDQTAAIRLAEVRDLLAG